MEEKSRGRSNPTRLHQNAVQASLLEALNKEARHGPSFEADPSNLIRKRIQRICETLRMAPRRKLFLDPASCVDHANGRTLNWNTKPDVIRHGHLLFAENHHDNGGESAR